MITFVTVSVTWYSFTTFDTDTSEGIWSILSVHLTVNPVDNEKDSAATKNFYLLQSWLDAFGNDRVAWYNVSSSLTADGNWFRADRIKSTQLKKNTSSHGNVLKSKPLWV